MSALYKKTIDLYEKLIEKENNSLYGKVIGSELEELKAIEQEIPKYGDEDYRKQAESVVRESRMNGSVGSSVTWVERLLNKNYTYK